MSFTNTMVNLWNNMGFTTFTWQQGVMIGISLILLFLAIGKKFEPLDVYKRQIQTGIRIITAFSQRQSNGTIGILLFDTLD